MCTHILPIFTLLPMFFSTSFRSAKLITRRDLFFMSPGTSSPLRGLTMLYCLSVFYYPVCDLIKFVCVAWLLFSSNARAHDVSFNSEFRKLRLLVAKEHGEQSPHAAAERNAESSTATRAAQVDTERERQLRELAEREEEEALEAKKKAKLDEAERRAALRTASAPANMMAEEVKKATEAVNKRKSASADLQFLEQVELDVKRAEEAKRKREAEIRAKEAEAKRKAAEQEAERLAKIEADAKRKREAQREVAAKEEEARRKAAEEEAKRKAAEEEAKRKASEEEEAKRQAAAKQAEAKRKAAAEAKRLEQERLAKLKIQREAEMKAAAAKAEAERKAQQEAAAKLEKTRSERLAKEKAEKRNKKIRVLSKALVAATNAAQTSGNHERLKATLRDALAGGVSSQSEAVTKASDVLLRKREADVKKEKEKKRKEAEAKRQEEERRANMEAKREAERQKELERQSKAREAKRQEQERRAKERLLAEKEAEAKRKREAKETEAKRLAEREAEVKHDESAQTEHPISTHQSVDTLVQAFLNSQDPESASKCIAALKSVGFDINTPQVMDRLLGLIGGENLELSTQALDLVKISAEKDGGAMLMLILEKSEDDRIAGICMDVLKNINFDVNSPRLSTRLGELMGSSNPHVKANALELATIVAERSGNAEALIAGLINSDDGLFLGKCMDALKNVNFDLQSPRLSMRLGELMGGPDFNLAMNALELATIVTESNGNTEALVTGLINSKDDVFLDKCMDTLKNVDFDVNSPRLSTRLSELMGGDNFDLAMNALELATIVAERSDDAQTLVAGLVNSKDDVFLDKCMDTLKNVNFDVESSHLSRRLSELMGGGNVGLAINALELATIVAETSGNTQALVTGLVNSKDDAFLAKCMDVLTNVDFDVQSPRLSTRLGKLMGGNNFDLAINALELATIVAERGGKTQALVTGLVNSKDDAFLAKCIESLKFVDFDVDAPDVVKRLASLVDSDNPALAAQAHELLSIIAESGGSLAKAVIETKRKEEQAAAADAKRQEDERLAAEAYANQREVRKLTKLASRRMKKQKSLAAKRAKKAAAKRGAEEKAVTMPEAVAMPETETLPKAETTSKAEVTAKHGHEQKFGVPKKKKENQKKSPTHVPTNAGIETNNKEEPGERQSQLSLNISPPSVSHSSGCDCILCVIQDTGVLFSTRARDMRSNDIPILGNDGFELPSQETRSCRSRKPDLTRTKIMGAHSTKNRRLNGAVSAWIADSSSSSSDEDENAELEKHLSQPVQNGSTQHPRLTTLEGACKVPDLPAKQFNNNVNLRAAFQMSLLELLVNETGLRRSNCRVKLLPATDVRGAPPKMRVGYHLRLRGNATRLTGAITKILKETFVDKGRRDVFLQSFWDCARKKERQTQARKQMLHPPDIHTKNLQTAGFARVGEQYGDDQRKKGGVVKSPSRYVGMPRVDRAAETTKEVASPRSRTSAWQGGRYTDPGHSSVASILVSPITTKFVKPRKSFVIDFTDSEV